MKGYEGDQPTLMTNNKLGVDGGESLRILLSIIYRNLSSALECFLGTYYRGK